MFNLETQQLLHRHGKDWYPMDPVLPEHTNPDDHDIERRVLRGQKVFRCVSCDEEICIDVPDEG